MAPPVALYGPSDLAKALKTTRQTVHNWRKAGLPCRMVSGSPKFDMAEVMDWRVEQERLKARPPEEIDEAKERARKIRADADLGELRLKERLGQVVPAADVQRVMERRDHATRARVLGIRGKFAPRVLGLATMAEATAALDGIAMDILASLRESADELETDDTGEEEAA